MKNLTTPKVAKTSTGVYVKVISYGVSCQIQFEDGHLEWRFKEQLDFKVNIF